jgi:hypothetical protein
MPESPFIEAFLIALWRLGFVLSRCWPPFSEIVVQMAEVIARLHVKHIDL